LGVRPDVLMWEDVAARLVPQQYQVLLYAAGESYCRTVQTPGDVDLGLTQYLTAGGCITFFPSGPWPFYYDESHQTVNRSSQFGLTLRIGWERPPSNTKLNFVQSNWHLPHVPKQFSFPTSGDLRWRPFFADYRHAKYVSMLQLCGDAGNYFGDAIAYAELKSGGRIVYTWFGLLNGPYAEALLFDVFDFVTTQVCQ